MSEEVLLRPAVLLILQDGQGRVLVGERRDFPGCWQFPQGGRKKGETNLEALRRETWEEIGLSASAYSDPASLGIWAYRFPPGVKKKRYGGQELVVFVAEYLGPPGWDERFAGSAEFSRIAWMVPREIPLEQLPDFKRSFYEAVLAEWSLAMNVTELSQSHSAGGR